MAEGLHVHASVVAASTSNIALPTAPATLDGVSLSINDRVLLKNQSTTSENGIYVVINGDLARAADYNTAAEIDPGDFVFVSGGTVNDNTGWVQTQTVTTLGTDPIVFTQFSGAGTYLAGTGLTLTGNTFSINTGTTVDVSTAQTLTNKTIALGNNTISGTIAQFNTALTDADFATLAGSEVLSNKELKSPTETMNIVASAATGTININAETSTIWYYTSNATANHTLNFRQSSSATLDSVLSVGESITAVWMNTNGTTPYYPNVIQVDGTTVTPKWSGGTAPSSGNASSIDVYAFNILKTASATFLVLGSQSRFA